MYQLLDYFYMGVNLSTYMTNGCFAAAGSAAAAGNNGEVQEQ
jgi:hypothetical protein